MAPSYGDPGFCAPLSLGCPPPARFPGSRALHPAPRTSRLCPAPDSPERLGSICGRVSGNLRARQAAVRTGRGGGVGGGLLRTRGRRVMQPLGPYGSLLCHWWLPPGGVFKLLCGGTGFPMPPAGVGREVVVAIALFSPKTNQQTNPSKQGWENRGFGSTAKHLRTNSV